MKYVEKTVTYTTSIFTMLSIISAALCLTGLNPPEPFAQTVAKILPISLVTAIFITVRDIFTKGRFVLELVTGVIGCAALVTAAGALCGWFELSLDNALSVFIITTLVYLAVWAVTALQSRREVQELNRLMDGINRGKPKP